MAGDHRFAAGRTEDAGDVMTALLQATALTKSFGATPALLGADLTVDAGEIVAVMGPSGPANRPCCTARPASCRSTSGSVQLCRAPS